MAAPLVTEIEQPSIVMLGRYAVSGQIAVGGMGSVHVGRLLGPAAFSRIVAIKKLLPHLVDDEDLVKMFLDEARLASRIRHPNVVPTLDVGTEGADIFLVMEYVHGESLHVLFRAAEKRGVKIPCNVIVAILVDALHGLQAAHDATSEQGTPLNLVHRDVSPQNILVGTDGIARVVDFGVAKAAIRDHVTRDGAVKGKLPYMAPEQLRGSAIDRRTDLYSATVILWEALTGRKLFQGESEGELVTRVMDSQVDPPSRFSPFHGATAEETARLDAVVLRGLAHDPANRYPNTQEMAVALEAAMKPASKADVASLVKSIVGERIERRAEQIAAFERATAGLPAPRASAPSHAPLPSERPPQVAFVPAPRRPSRVPYAIALFFLFGIAAIAAIRWVKVKQAGAVPMPRPSTSVSATPPNDDPPNASVIPSPTITPPSAPSSGKRRLRIRPHPSASVSGAPVPPPGPDCDPPWTRDSNGVIMHKPECIGVP